MLSHFSNALSEMAESLMDLEDGYFKALREVIIETERALQDVSRIDAHYVSQVVTVMAFWQEAVQATATHIENADLTIYLAQRATREYLATVIKAHEEHDVAQANEAEARKQAIKSSDPEDPVIRLLEATHRAACAQAERAVDASLRRLRKLCVRTYQSLPRGP